MGRLGRLHPPDSDGNRAGAPRPHELFGLTPAQARENTVDKFSIVRLFRGMAQPETKLTSPASLIVDAILVVGFFIFIYTTVAPHVPTNDKSMELLWGGLCSACMTGVFWLCVQMFRVVLRAQRAAGKK